MEERERERYSTDQSLLPVIVELAEDTKWKVRLAIMPLFAEKLVRVV